MGEYELNVKSVSGQAFKVIFTNKTTVAELKRDIAPRVNVQEAELSIVYQGKQLMDDNKRVMDYDIEDKATVHLVFRLRG